MKLHAKLIRALMLGGNDDKIYFDETMPGFGFRLRRSSSGRVLRSWVVQYRCGNVSRRIKLGSAEVLSAEQARAAAKKVLAKVALGDDPQVDRTGTRHAVTRLSDGRVDVSIGITVGRRQEQR